MYIYITEGQFLWLSSSIYAVSAQNLLGRLTSGAKGIFSQLPSFCAVNMYSQHKRLKQNLCFLYKFICINKCLQIYF